MVGMGTRLEEKVVVLRLQELLEVCGVVEIDKGTKELVVLF